MNFFLNSLLKFPKLTEQLVYRNIKRTISNLSQGLFVKVKLIYRIILEIFMMVTRGRWSGTSWRQFALMGFNKIIPG